MKRAAERQITKDDDLDAEADEDVQTKTYGFTRAPPEVMARRRILKGRRTLPRPGRNAAPRPNPFANAAFSLSPKDSGAGQPGYKVGAEAKGGVGERKADAKHDLPERAEGEELAQGAGDKKLAEAEAIGATRAENEVIVKEKDHAPPKEEERRGDKPGEGNKTEGSEKAKERDPREMEPSDIRGGAKSEQSATVSDEKATLSAARPTDAGHPAKGGTSAIVKGTVNGIAGRPSIFGAGSAPQLTFGSLSDANANPERFAMLAKDSKPVAEESDNKADKGFKALDKVVTGEEEDETRFKVRARLYGTIDHEKGIRWKEKGTGDLKINVNKKTGKARLVMRAQGTFRLLLNSPVFHDMKIDRANETSARMHVIDVESESGSLKFHLVRVPREKDMDDLLNNIADVKE